MKKYLKNLLGLSVILFGMASCGGAQNEGAYPFEEEPPFTLGQVTFQKWVAGIRGGGSGINVTIPVEELTADVRFKELYFRDHIVSIKSKPREPDLFFAYIKTKGNRDIIMDADPAEEAKNTPPQKVPFDLDEDEAVLSYELGGEIFYVFITDMEEKPMLAYPQGNPGSDH